MNTGLIDAHTHIGVDLMFSLRGHYPYALDWPTLVRLGEDSGVDRFVVFPMVSNLSMNVEEMLKGRVSKKNAFEKVPYAHENRRMMVEIERYFPEIAHKALPFWMVDPAHEQKGQVEALRALKGEFRCSGLKIQGTIIESEVIDLLGKGECLLDFAEEHGLPFLIHSSVHPDDKWSQVEDLLKVAEARPGIHFNLAHSCRFDKKGLDRIAELPNAWFDCSAHRIHCMLAADESPIVAHASQRFPSDYRDPKKVLSDLAKAYPSKLMWGSDAPFDSYIDTKFSLRSSYREEADALHSLDKADVQRIAHDNILKYLNLSA